MDIDRRKAVLFATGLGVTGFLFGAYLLEQTRQTPEINSPQLTFPMPADAYDYPFPETPASPAEGEQPDIIENGWNPNCQVINNPGAFGYNPTLPINRNAFRAVKAAGDPNVVEDGPYLHTPGKFGIKVRKHLRLYTGPQKFQTLDGLEPDVNPVHNGDEICIKQEGSSIPVSNKVIYEAQKHEGKFLAHKGLEIRTKLQAKQRF